MATIEKRGNTYRVKIRRQGYQPVSATFANKKDATIWARKTEAEMDSRTFVDFSKADATTLGEVFTAYRKGEVPNHKGASVEECRMKAWEVRHPLRERPLSKVTSSAVRQWRDQRLKEVSAATVIYELALLHRAIEYARTELEIPLPDNPVSKVKRPKNPSGRDRRLLPPDDELQFPGEEVYLRRACARMRDDWFSHFITLALETAARRSELLGLLWQDVNLTSRVALFRDTKNGENRHTPLSSKAVAAFEQLPRAHERVFPRTPNSVKLAWKRLVKHARELYDQDCSSKGLTPDPRFFDDLRLHDLRHEATSRLAEQGFSALEVSSITGHKDLRMLKRYTHLFATDLAARLG